MEGGRLPWTLRLVVVLVPELTVQGLCWMAVELDVCCLVGSLCVVRSCPLTELARKKVTQVKLKRAHG